MLRDLAKSPLMLSVMTLAYQGASVAALSAEAASTAEIRRKQIFDTYVDRMFARKSRAGSEYDKRQVIGWLAWLARNLQRHGHTVFLIEQMQPSWLMGVRNVFAYIVLSRLAAAIAMVGILALSVADTVAAALAVLFAAGLGGVWSSLVDIAAYRQHLLANVDGRMQPTAKDRKWLALVHAIGWAAIGWAADASDGLFLIIASPGEGADSPTDAVLLLVVLAVMFFGFRRFRAPYDSDIQIFDSVRWSWKAGVKTTLKIVPFVACIIAFQYFWIQLDIGIDPKMHAINQAFIRIFEIIGFMALLIIGIFFVLPLGFLVGGFVPTIKNTKRLHSYGIRMAIKTCLRSTGLIVVVFGSWVSFLAFSSGGLKLKVLPFLVTMITISLFGGLWYGGLDVLRHYLLRLIAVWLGYMPRRYAHFLEHCSKLVFLQNVGGGYIFIHRMLLEHFAVMWEGERGDKEKARAPQSGGVLSSQPLT